VTPVEILFYTRRDCSLCEKAKEIVNEVVGRMDATVLLVEIDIDQDPVLRLQFSDDIPVIFIGGRKRFKHHVDAAVLEKHLRAAMKGRTWAPAWTSTSSGSR